MTRPFSLEKIDFNFVKKSVHCIFLSRIKCNIEFQDYLIKMQQLHQKKVTENVYNKDIPPIIFKV